MPGANLVTQEANLAKTPPSALMQFTDDQVALIKSTIFQGCSDNELALFMHYCTRTGLDPFARQIYAFKDSKNRVSFITSVDGYRLIAERTGKYEGQTPTQWCGEDGEWKDIWTTTAKPIASRTGIYRKGFREPLYAVVMYAEFAQDKDTWKKMPAHMLGKVSEVMALRKAFPNDLSGLSVAGLTDEPVVVPPAPTFDSILSDIHNATTPIELSNILQAIGTINGEDNQMALKRALNQRREELHIDYNRHSNRFEYK